MNEKEIVQELKKELSPLFEQIFERFDSMDERFEKRFDGIEDDIRSIKLNIENYIWPAIQEIKDGHAQYAKEVQEFREDIQWLKDSVEENTAMIGVVAKEAGVALAEKI